MISLCHYCRFCLTENVDVPTKSKRNVEKLPKYELPNTKRSASKRERE